MYKQVFIIINTFIFIINISTIIRLLILVVLLVIITLPVNQWLLIISSSNQLSLKLNYFVFFLSHQSSNTSRSER